MTTLPDEDAKPGPPPMNVTNRLAYERTHLALERTMQAWIRTALSLISFGFTINKFFQFVTEKYGPQNVGRVMDPQQFGSGMIAVGLFTLLLATIQHALSMAQMRREYPATPRSLAAVLAGMLALLGIAAMVSAVLQ